MGLVYSENNKVSNGGTERMMRELEKRLSHQDVSIFTTLEVLQKVQTQKRIFWTHEVPARPNSGDIEYDFFKNGIFRFVNGLVFVSYWQMEEYLKIHPMSWNDWDKCRVLHNAIDPIEDHEKPKDKIGLIYMSNPSRGLDILYESFFYLAQKHDDVELNVFSSASLYGRSHEDQKYEKLFNDLKNHPKVNFYGSVDNSRLREELKKNHIFAYPCTYGETSCISLIEAMSSGLLCVHPNQCALSETASGWTNMYHYQANTEKHIDIFTKQLDNAVRQIKNGDVNHLQYQKKYADYHFSWKKRITEWEDFLAAVV